MTTRTDENRTGPGGGQAKPEPAPLRGLSPVELLRWTWRQLTSMRTALLLLFLLALGAIPGSVIPQNNVDSVRSSQWRQQHPSLTPIYEKLGLFDVYHSVWFSAIYLLLVISLVGCIVPRLQVYGRALRARPPAPPRNLARLPESRTGTVDEPADAVLEKAAANLRRRRFRISRHDGAISGERGYLREAGNLVFHLAVLVVLAGVAISQLFGYEGGVIVVTGHGFSNSLSQYDDFVPGTFFKPAQMQPFSLNVKDFHVSFIRSGRQQGMAHKFDADVSYRTAPGRPLRTTNLAVNHPLHIDGTSVYLLSHGYAPHITVRDGKGRVISSGPVVFLPEDQTFRSFGVVKAPDGVTRSGKPEQIGLMGEFYPTYVFTDRTGPFSAFPDDKNPAISMSLFTGDLGLDNGVPQSVYSLNMKHLHRVTNHGKPVVNLMRGQRVQLPHGMGSVTFDGVSRYVKLQVNRSPADWLALLGMVLALAGLLGSLFVRPRRVWVRVRREGGRSLVEVAGLDRSSIGGGLADELDAVIAHLGADGPEPQPEKEQNR